MKRDLRAIGLKKTLNASNTPSLILKQLAVSFINYQGLEEFFRDPRFDQNTLRESGKR